MLSIFLVGIALSMDAFSIALSIGLNRISTIKSIFLSILIGIMHFFMPAFGLFLGSEILKIININVKIIVSLVFIYLAFIIYKDKSCDKTVSITSIVSILIISFSVSIDSFSVGMCLPGLTHHYFLSFIIFTICSSAITYIGLIIGKYSVKFLKEKANIFACIILLIMSIVNLCQIFSH